MPEIRTFLLDRAALHPGDLVSVTARRFGVTRQAVHAHLSQLLREGLLAGSGRTRARRYQLAVLEELRTIVRSQDLDEDAVWREHLKAAFSGVASSVVQLCRLGLTETLRNAAEHSGADEVAVRVRRTAASVEIAVSDSGRGIFHRLGPDDPRRAALDLVKGRPSTDPDWRSGRGFSCIARGFDSVTVWSGHHRLRRDERGEQEEWLLEELGGRVRGTTVALRIHPRSQRTLAEVVGRAIVERDGAVLARAEVPVHLASESGELPISRATARRLLAGLGRFGQVVLDFGGIDAVGPAFADEVGRVFRRENPGVEISVRGASPAVERMLRRPQPSG